MSGLWERVPRPLASYGVRVSTIGIFRDAPSGMKISVKSFTPSRMGTIDSWRV